MSTMPGTRGSIAGPRAPTPHPVVPCGGRDEDAVAGVHAERLAVYRKLEFRNLSRPLRDEGDLIERSHAHGNPSILKPCSNEQLVRLHLTREIYDLAQCRREIRIGVRDIVHVEAHVARVPSADGHADAIQRHQRDDLEEKSVAANNEEAIRRRHRLLHPSGELRRRTDIDPAIQ